MSIYPKVDYVRDRGVRFQFAILRTAYASAVAQNARWAERSRRDRDRIAELERRIAALEVTA